MKQRLITYLNANSNAHSGALVTRTPAQVAAVFNVSPAVAYMLMLPLVSEGYAKQYRSTSSDRMLDSFSTKTATAPV